MTKEERQKVAAQVVGWTDARVREVVQAWKVAKRLGAVPKSLYTRTVRGKVADWLLEDWETRNPTLEYEAVNKRIRAVIGPEVDRE